jgi:7-keto-8-aminopelargonate synthetase-like enzyme
MIKISKEIEWINQTFVEAKQLGIFKAVSDDEKFDGKNLKLKGKDVVFWGNCSYMGLEQHPEIKLAAKEAIDKYGIYFSSSRSFLGLEIYEQLEEKLQLLFGKPVNITTSTTFAHIANLPILIGKNDAVIIDNYVHSSLQTAIKICKADGIYVEIIRHSRLDLLEERIKHLQTKYDNIWYMIDGVYSMMGDGAPMKELKVLLNKYEQFYVYADDAHGTSWTGKNGVGYVLNEIEFHDKLYMGLSLSKGFGVGGGLMIYPNQKIKEIVKNCGKTMIFSAPAHPSTIMSAIKSAEIHMRPEFVEMQMDIKRKIEYFWKKANQLNIPLSGDFKTPIFFVGLGNIENTTMICTHLLNSGFFVSACSYPSVPHKNTGIRMTISRFIELQDIDNLLESINGMMVQLEKAGKLNREQIKKDFLPRKSKEKDLV